MNDFWVLGLGVILVVGLILIAYKKWTQATTLERIFFVTVAIVLIAVTIVYWP
jgi:hypothetical protein